MFYRQLLDAIANIVDPSNINQFCSVLDCEEKCVQLVHSIVKYYSTCLVINSRTCDNPQLDLLTKILAEHKFLDEADYSKIHTEVKNKTVCLLNVLHTKPIIFFSFLETLNTVEPLQPLQLEIYRKIAKTKDDIREIEKLYCGKLTNSNITNVPGVLYKYQTYLKLKYDNLPEISKQGWYNDRVKKPFVNVTLVKSLEKNENEIEEFFSPEHTIEGEVVYGTQEYVNYDEIFQIDSSTHQLLLFEGNAGTGKTTFSYKILKTWAKEKVLKQYSCVVLVELRDLKPDTVISLESLFGAMALGESVSSDICTEVSRLHGNKILIWLEGWDELDAEFMHSTIFEDLLSGRVLPQATIVITTRPSATRSLKRFNFTHKFKLTGFIPEQITKYVNRYCTNDCQSDVAEKFMADLNIVPGLVFLAKVPLYLAILVKLFKAKKRLPDKLTDICSNFLKICLQYHKEKVLRDNRPITSFDDLPSDMQRIFYCMQKCAYDRFLFHSQRSFTEQQISHDIFNGLEVPRSFDGLGLFTVKNPYGNLGISKTYDFLYKPIQEMLAALYLTRLQSVTLIKELSDTFGKKDYEMVWVFYAGLTDLKQVPIKKVLVIHKMTLQQQPSITLPGKSISDLIKAWKYCHSYYIDITNNLSIEFLLTLMLCCYEAKNSEACRDIANHLYTDKVCRFEIPPNHATPYLLLAVSYFISHSGKTWSLRCNAVVQSGIELLFKHINDSNDPLTSPKAMSHLWVFCCVVTSSDIDAYCNAIKSQSSLQWIHLLPGSYLDDDGISKLCECFCFNGKVIKIAIDDCGISSKGLRSVAHMLSINQKILYIDLRKNNFALDDVKEFLQHIIKNQHLQYLLLDKNFCENSEVCELSRNINLGRAENTIHLNISSRGTDLSRN